MTKRRPKPPAVHQPQPPAPQTTVTAFKGPLPPPQVLDQYNQIVPGAAERIVRLFEIQVDHRQRLESSIISSDVRDSRLGLILGALVSIAAITGGVFAIIYGHPTTGGIIAAIPVPTLAAVFVYGSRKRRLEREQRRNP